MFSINSQGHLGIGVNNASGAIQAKGIIRADAQSSDTFGIVCFNSAVTAGSGNYFNNDNAQVILKDSTNVIKTKISSSGFSWFNGGGVGFGTTTPAAPIEMVVNNASGKGLLLSNVGDNSAYDSIRVTYSGYGTGSPECIFQPKTQPGTGSVDTYFRFKTNGGELAGNKANLTVDGKVGIGTTNDVIASRLTVAKGDIEVTEYEKGLILRSTNGTRYRLVVANDGTLTTTAV